LRKTCTSAAGRKEGSKLVDLKAIVINRPGQRRRQPSEQNINMQSDQKRARLAGPVPRERRGKGSDNLQLGWRVRKGRRKPLRRTSALLEGGEGEGKRYQRIPNVIPTCSKEGSKLGALEGGGRGALFSLFGHVQ